MREIATLQLNLKAPETFGNVAEKLSADDRRILASDLIELIGIDETSMNNWLTGAKRYLDEIEQEGEQTPQDREQAGADEDEPPSTELTLSAVVQFAARATDALLGEPDLAKASETGAEPLASWVSSQLRTKDMNWTLDTDPLTVHMAVTGLAWRKRDFDEEDEVFHSYFRPSTHVIINANVKSVERAPRVTDDFEKYPYEIQRSIERGKWVDYEPRFDERDPQASKRFYECDCWLDLDGDDYVEPWTVTISRDDTPEVVRIRPRWSRKTVTDNEKALYFNPVIRFYPYRFLPNPSGKFLPMGFGKILDRVQNSADMLLASIVDTAQSESENGGVFTGEGLGIPDKVELKNNRATKIPTDGRPVAEIWSQFPTKSVSSGSVAILEKLLTLGDRVAGTLNLLENAPASMTATMAKGIIDTGTQVQSAVHRRMCASMTEELRMFVAMADAYDQLPDEVKGSQKDGIAVTADPQLATEMHRTAMGGLYMEMIGQAAEGVPWNVQELQMRFARVMRLPSPEKLLKPAAPAEATPWEKMQGVLGLQKNSNERIKTIGDVALKLTQSLKNMVDASGGMQDQRASLLNMALLEHTVMQLMQEASGNDTSGMAAQPGNATAPSLHAPSQGGSGGDVSGGQSSGPDDTGASGGVQ